MLYEILEQYDGFVKEFQTTTNEDKTRSENSSELGVKCYKKIRSLK